MQPGSYALDSSYGLSKSRTSPNPGSGAGDGEHSSNLGGTFSQHFIKTLQRKLHDPTLLQTCPPPPPELFKHTSKQQQQLQDASTALMHHDVWGSLEHPFTAPPGSFRLLSSDYAHLDAPKAQGRARQQQQAAAELMEAEDPPDPPLFMQQTKFFANARLVLIKLRQQLEEVCVDSVRQLNARVAAEAERGSLPSARSVLPAGGLPLAVVEEVAEAVRGKLCAAFEDCLSDTMDQLWGSLQYAGSKHALVERLKQAMLQREAELEALAIKQREELQAKIKGLMRQMEDVREEANKDRAQMQAMVISAQQRIEFLGNDVAGLRGKVEKEKQTASSRIDAVRHMAEAQLRAKDDALEALRSETTTRMEEMRALTAGLHEQLRLRQAELEALNQRAGDQAALLEAAFQRRDMAVKAATLLQHQLDDVKKFFESSCPLSLPLWLSPLREDGRPLTPIDGGPLELEFGTGRALIAAARDRGCTALVALLRSMIPEELPVPDSWNEPDVDPSAASQSSAPASPNSFGHSLSTRDGMPETLPQSWHRFLRAPLGDVLHATQLQALLMELLNAKLAADRLANERGEAGPSLHVCVYRHFLKQHMSVARADAAVVSLIQSLRQHASKLQRAATWLQMLHLTVPVLPADAVDVYVRVFDTLRSPMAGHAANHISEDGVTWVASTKWKALLSTGPIPDVFEGGFRSMLMKQAGNAHVEVSRAKPYFGMSDLDGVAAGVMAAWLAQRDAAHEAVGKAWGERDVRGDGCLDVWAFKEVLAGVAGDDAVPSDEPLLDLYHSAVQAARTQQVVQRVTRPGISAPACAAAMAQAGLLPPLPVRRRGGLDASRLAVAVDHLLRLAEAAEADLLAQLPRGIRLSGVDSAQYPVLAELQACAARLRLRAGSASPPEKPHELAEGWAAVDAMALALLKVREEIKAHHAAQLTAMENAVAARVGMLDREAQAAEMHAGDGGGSAGGTLGRRRLSSGGTRSPGGRPSSASTQVQRASGIGSARQSSGGVVRQPSADVGSVHDGGSVTFEERLASARNSGGGRPKSALGSGGPRGATLKHVGISEGAAEVWPDLRSILAKGHISEDDNDDEDVLASERDADGAPVLTSADVPRLQLRLSSRPGSAHSRTGRISISSTTTARVLAQMSASPRQQNSSGAGTTRSAGGDGGADADLAALLQQPEAAEALAAELARMERKYNRLRARYDEALQGLEAAVASGSGYSSARGQGKDVGSRLREIAEQLASLHAECERGLWPRMQSAVQARLAPAFELGQGGAPGEGAEAEPPLLQAEEGAQWQAQLGHQADQITQAMALLALEVVALAQSLDHLHGRPSEDYTQQLLALAAAHGLAVSEHEQLPGGSTSPRWRPGSALHAAAGHGGHGAGRGLEPLDDPRDRPHLEALRALHVAAGAEGEDLGALQEAVQKVVGLMGGHPRITASGTVIEFYPLRMPKDWRQPLLRSSLLRLYVYISGLLLQQQERHALLKAAGEDLVALHAVNKATADELQQRGDVLQGLQASLASQLAAQAALVTHGSDLSSALQRLQLSTSTLQAHLGPPGAVAEAARTQSSGLFLQPPAWVEASEAAAAAAAGLQQACQLLERLRTIAVAHKPADAGSEGPAQPEGEGNSASRAGSGDEASAAAAAAAAGGAPAAAGPMPAAWPQMRLPQTSKSPFVQGIIVRVRVQREPQRHHRHPWPSDLDSSSASSHLLSSRNIPRDDALAGSQAGPPCSAQPEFGFALELPGPAAAPPGQKRVGPTRMLAGDSDSDDSGSEGMGEQGAAKALTAELPEVPDAPTPVASPRGPAKCRGAAGLRLRYTLEFVLQAAYDSLSGNPNLPRGEQLVKLSNSMLARSQMGRQRAGGSPGRGAGAGVTLASAPADDRLSLERRPLTARSYVEGVMEGARRRQLALLARPMSAMPQGGLEALQQDMQASAANEQQQQGGAGFSTSGGLRQRLSPPDAVAAPSRATSARARAAAISSGALQRPRVSSAGELRRAAEAARAASGGSALQLQQQQTLQPDERYRLAAGVTGSRLSLQPQPLPVAAALQQTPVAVTQAWPAAAGDGGGSGPSSQQPPATAAEANVKYEF